MNEITKSRKRKKARTIAKKVGLNIFFVALCFITLVPVIYCFGISFGAKNSLLSSDVNLLPKEWTIENYITLFSDSDIGTWFLNTLILAVSSVVISLAVAIPSAYAFSRMRFLFRKTILNFLIILNAFPAVLSMFAIYRLITNMGLNNTKFGLIIIYSGTMSIFCVWNLKGYFDTIPYEIEEAAEMDGASSFQIISRIVMPLAKPALSVTAVMVLIYVWNEYIFSTTFLTGSENFTLAAGLYSLQASETTGSWPVFFAASLVVSIPILVVFMSAQKNMVSGLSAGGVKE